MTSNIFSLFDTSHSTFINLKIVLLNDIIIYEDASVVVKLFIVAKIYFNIWQKKTTDTINISEEEWMSVDTISKVKFESVRVFKLSKQNRDVIDKKFDELHRQEKMS